MDEFRPAILGRKQETERSKKHKQRKSRGRFLHRLTYGQIYKVDKHFYMKRMKNRSERQCLPKGKVVEDLRAAKEVAVLFSVLAVVQWCLGIKLKK